MKALASLRQEIPISSEKVIHQCMCMNFITVQQNTDLPFCFLLSQYFLFSYRKENYIYMFSEINSWASQTHSTKVKISLSDNFL